MLTLCTAQSLTVKIQSVYSEIHKQTAISKRNHYITKEQTQKNQNQNHETLR